MAKELLAPVEFLVLFLVVVGGALYLTPRLAAWIDRRRAVRRNPMEDVMEGLPGESDFEEVGKREATQGKNCIENLSDSSADKEG